ncbi:MAG: threonylcarbamoyl-AMP synthase [Verrucomicrobiota bacterium]|nr:threonylcarbamoyl-AMP synthase [Verrucomicrobiota bacterium]
MSTLLLSPNQIDRAVSLLKAGEPVAIPTETVYGLAAPIFNEEGVKKIFFLKGRPSDNPLIAHVTSLEMAEQVVDTSSPHFRPLVNRFWPGPLTLVLPKKERVPDIVSGGHSTLGVRMPKHKIALQLIEAVGEPLVAPSANLSGKPSPTCFEHVLEDFAATLAAVIDGGECSLGIESTVLSLVGETPVILRPGSITREQLEKVLRCSIAIADEKTPAVSPGMKYRHYAPKGTVRIISHPSEIGGAFVLSKDPISPYLHRPLSAKTFYMYLREADRTGAEVIWVFLDPVSATDEALMNRLLRSAGF